MRRRGDRFRGRVMVCDHIVKIDKEAPVNRELDTASWSIEIIVTLKFKI